jgi:predicted ATPase/DNA-binding SARP family transcriptional activator
MRIGLLGPVEVTEGETGMPLGGAKDRALLALLAVHAGRVVSDDRILEELWGDALPDNPSNALQKRVSQLRKAIGASRIARHGEGYLLDVTADEVDALAFEARVVEGRKAVAAGDMGTASALLADALELWRGPALAEFADLSFARSEAGRLEELRLSALEDRVESDLALGRHGSLPGELSALVADHPLRERLRGQLMLALYRAGRQADALRAYADGRAVLIEELGLDPGPELRALEAAILAHDLALAAPPPPGAAGGNLRAPLTSFVGRDAELALVLDRLAHHRLVTLTGPGGAGKTRLATEVGAVVAAAVAGGVWLVELAPLIDGVAVPDAVAAAVGARETSGGGLSVPAVERIRRQLAGRDVVLVIDNCEHVIDAVAELTAAVLGGCPGTRVLATSREPLGVGGEAQVPVTSMAAEEAERLFIERAQAVRPGFDPDGDTRTAVAEVCRRLDGLPLAIELAASRVKALPVEHIVRRLDDRFRLLTGGSRTVLPRHQTLRAAVEWSYDLLFEDERAVFDQLAVFAGGFDHDDAVAVCGAAGVEADDMVDLLGHLVDKSLLVAEPSGRYRMLETLRQYGIERLAERGRLDDARSAHAECFLALAEEALPRTFGADQLRWLGRVDGEHDNFRAALDWLTLAAPVRGLQLAGALAWPWWLRGHRQEARHVLDVALDSTGEDADPLVRCRALRWAGYLTSATGWAGTLHSVEDEQALAQRRCETAIALSIAAGDAAELAHAQRQLAVTLTRNVAYGGIADVDTILDLLHASEAAFCRLGNAWGVGTAHIVLAFAGLATGDVTMAERAIADARVALVGTGERFALGRMVGAEAMLAELTGDTALACARYREGVALSRELGLEEVVAAHLTQLARLGGDDADSIATAHQLSPDDLATDAGVRNRLGEAAFAAGDLERAESLHRQALDSYRHLGTASGVATSLFRLAEVGEARGDRHAADRLRAFADDAGAPSRPG